MRLALRSAAGRCSSASCHRAAAGQSALCARRALSGRRRLVLSARELRRRRRPGSATVYPSGHADLTTDGEVFDQTALAAAHQTLQLPAIARLTNLENGRQVLVRINDRGPATPHRLIEVTRRTATLLGFPGDGAVRVRLEVLPAESHAAVDAVPGAPKLEIAAAPRGEVQQSDLPPPGSAARRAAPCPTAAPRAGAAPAAAHGCALPETVTQVAPDPGQLVRAARHVPELPIRQHPARARRRPRREHRQHARRARADVSGHHRAASRACSRPTWCWTRCCAAGVTDARIVVE